MVHFVAEGSQDEARIFIECLTRASGGVPIHNQAQTRGRVNAGLLLGKKFDHLTVNLSYALKTKRFAIQSPAAIQDATLSMIQALEKAYCKHNTDLIW